ncbi:Acylphosphatase [Dissostichus eleginoides]|uniref:Acylphosphatase n=1 Tax=Dissostichus eleginoides TaxID=100907 RepID=A0AAD9CJS5_DISEL|nr:Acylphosphatase [Dissostichus eleginoides]
MSGDGEDDEDLLRGGEPTATGQIHEGGPIRHSSGGEDQARVEQSGEDKRENEDTGELDDPYSTDPGLWGNNMDEQVLLYWAKMGPELCQNREADLSASERQYKHQKRYFSRSLFKRKLEHFTVADDQGGFAA